MLLALSWMLSCHLSSSTTLFNSPSCLYLSISQYVARNLNPSPGEKHVITFSINSGSSSMIYNAYLAASVITSNRNHDSQFNGNYDYVRYYSDPNRTRTPTLTLPPTLFCARDYTDRHCVTPFVAKSYCSSHLSLNIVCSLSKLSFCV